MTSTWLIWILFAAYMVIAVVAGVEGNWPRALYFVSAGQISLAVMWMGAR